MAIHRVHQFLMKCLFTLNVSQDCSRFQPLGPKDPSGAFCHSDKNLLLLFPGTKAAEFQLEKQPHPGVCTPMAYPGGDSPTLHQILPHQDAFSPNTKHVGLEKPQC